CVDACGQKWKLTQEGNNFFFIKGRMWINGGVLFREGKSGIVMRFRREEEMQDDFEFDLEEQEQELESSSEEEEEGEEEEEQDSLQVLENMVSEVYWDH
ncbi:Protein disulfide isomerase-like 2-1, partial [Durusdinium trenchii]